MILYRIIDKEEFEAYKKGEKYNGYRDTEDWKDANNLYENDGSGTGKFIYFFPYHEACNLWNGDFVIKVDIPDSMLEHGLGAYIHPYGKSFQVQSVLLDEYRMNSNKFNSQFIIDEVPIEEFHNQTIENKWGKSSDFSTQLEDSLHKKTVLVFPHSCEFIDYSGVPEPECCIISEESKEIVDLIKPILIESANQTRELSFKHFKNVRRSTNIQEFTEFSEEIMHDSLESRIEHIVKMYGLDVIKTLFRQGQCSNQIRDIIGVLSTGILANGLYSEVNIRDLMYVEANKLYGRQFEEGIVGEENLLYIANELANFSSEEYEERKQFFYYKCVAPLYQYSNGESMISIRDLPLYLYGDDLSNVPMDMLNVCSSKEYELAKILKDFSKTDKEKQKIIEDRIQMERNNGTTVSSQASQQTSGANPKQDLDEI